MTKMQDFMDSTIDDIANTPTHEERVEKLLTLIACFLSVIAEDKFMYEDDEDLEDEEVFLA